MELSDERKVVAYEEKLFGGFEHVLEYGNDDRSLLIPVLSQPGAPGNGLVSYATVGLSGHEIVAMESWPRVEFLGAAQARWEGFPDSLASAAFRVITGANSVKPGYIYRDLFVYSNPGTTTPHGLLWHPFSWEPYPENQEIAGLTVTFLQVIPITEAEFQFIDAKDSVEALLEIFDTSGPDIYDLGRPSSV